MSDTASVDA